MGIPYYFTYIVKNHSNIIKKLNKDILNIKNFYLDSNSIIYDVVNKMNFDEMTLSIHTSIINNVISKIEYYISIVKPTNMTYIAFDGVAPVAKLKQQRERRYKSYYQAEIAKNTSVSQKTNANPFNMTSITPGTKFMEELNTKIREYFKRKYYKENDIKIIFSGSNEEGEGEHKIFEHIRKNGDEDMDAKYLIYGLDADLIMLSINHLPIHSNIYLFRETPEFIKSLNIELEPNENYYLDIPELANEITNYLNSDTIETGTEQVKQVNRIYDYIFLCFFLGNDFLPHFPALNIRTGGTEKLLNAYTHTITGNDVLTDGEKIYWHNVRKLLLFLSCVEEKFIKEEMKVRDKRERKYPYNPTAEQKLMMFENIPLYDRELEKYISPNKDGWQQRYYDSLFENYDIKNDEEFKKNLCVNFLQGLEWTMKYYTQGCADWRWKYNYEYPPLLQDLIHFTPYFNVEFFGETNTNTNTNTNSKSKALHPYVQLCYVLPKKSLYLLPTNIYKEIMEKYPEWYTEDNLFKWAFCKYFWESHVVLPEIDLDVLENIVIKHVGS